MSFPPVHSWLTALTGLAALFSAEKLVAELPVAAIQTNGVLRVQWSAESLFPLELRPLPPIAWESTGPPWNRSQYPVLVNGQVQMPHYLVQGSADLLNWELVSSNAAPAFGRSVSQTVDIPVSDAPDHRFFRIRRSLNARVAFYRWSWVGANLTGADLSGAQLMGSDLRWAQLAEADLRGADLRGANLFGANLSGAMTNGAIMPDLADSVEDPDAQLLALELSGELEAPPLLYEQLRYDLQRIREAYPVVRGVRFFGGWEPGVILHYRDLSAATGLGQLLTPRPFRITEDVWHLPQRFHPEVLARQWQATMIPGPTASLRRIDHPMNNITADPVTRQYEFLMAWGDCIAGCIFKHRWVFAAAGDAVRLLEETGPPVELFPSSTSQ